MEEGPLDRDDVDHVETDQRGAQPIAEPKRMLDGGLGVVRAIERDQDALDHEAGAPCRASNIALPPGARPSGGLCKPPGLR